MMKTRKISRTSASVPNSRWIAYATAGAATALAAVNTAEADIHYSGPINQSFNASPGSVTSSYFQLDAPGNSINPFHARTSSGTIGVAKFFMYGIVSGAFAGFTSGGFSYVSKLSFGQNVSTRPGFESGDGTLAFGYGYGNSEWLDPGIGFVGFRFNGGSGIQYGWARLDMDGNPDNSFTLVDYGWGDVGDSITAGQIPEPGSLALLALGGLGLVAWRRQRAKAAGQN